MASDVIARDLLTEFDGVNLKLEKLFETGTCYSVDENKQTTRFTAVTSDFEEYAPDDDLHTSSGPGICPWALPCISRIRDILRCCCCCCYTVPEDIVQEPELSFPCQETSMSSVRPF